MEVLCNLSQSVVVGLIELVELKIADFFLSLSSFLSVASVLAGFTNLKMNAATVPGRRHSTFNTVVSVLSIPRRGVAPLARTMLMHLDTSVA